MTLPRNTRSDRRPTVRDAHRSVAPKIASFITTYRPVLRVGMALVCLASSGIAAPALGSEWTRSYPAPSDDGTSPDPRYGERHAFSAPPGSIVPELRSRTGERISFSPLIDDILEEFSATDFDQRLRDLSGENSVLIGGSSYTFRTRHTFSEGGEKSWQYAYERLEALGLDVRYQEFVWNGNHFQNVIATIEGEVTPERVYVLGGHIDSISPQADTLAPGAEDNGSGSSGVMAAAAALAGARFESTIELVLFTGEEQGLWGSYHYVDVAMGLGVDIRAAVILDMIAYHNDDYGVLIEGESAWSDLMGSFGDAIDQYTGLDKEYSYHSWGSDHVPFQDANIPAILAIDLDWSEYPYYHSTEDTYDKTTPALGVDIARAALATVAQLAGPIETPSAVGPDQPFLVQTNDVMLRAYPNPAGSTVQFELEAPARSAVGRDSRLVIADVNGRIVRSLSLGGSGNHAAPVWDLRSDRGDPIATGVYWARVGSAEERIVVVR